MGKHLVRAAASAWLLAITVTPAGATSRCAIGDGAVGPGNGAAEPATTGQDLEELRRGETSTQRLQIKWESYVPRVAMDKLDAAGALREIRGQNPKPVLLLRDCDSCPGKEDSSVEKALLDERILLGSRWFHCVRVDRGVLKDTHPLNALFTATKAPHIVFFATTSNDRADLDGRNSKALWDAMSQTLKKDYKKSPDAAMSSWIPMLSRFDTLDAKKAELITKRQVIKDTRKATDIDKKLMDLEAEIAKALEEEKKITNLELRPPVVAGTPAVDHDAEAADAVGKGKGKPTLLDKVKKDQEKKDGEKKEPEKK